MAQRPRVPLILCVASSHTKYHEGYSNILDYIGEQQSLDTTLALLQTETAKSEEDSEVYICKNYDINPFFGSEAQNSVSTSTYLGRFIPKRQTKRVTNWSRARHAEDKKIENSGHTPRQNFRWTRMLSLDYKRIAVN